MDFARAIRTCRALRGWPQERLAKEADLHPSYISLLESGARTPSFRTVKKIAEGLGVPESLLTLLATDPERLPLSIGKNRDQLANALLDLLVQAGNERTRS